MKIWPSVRPWADALRWGMGLLLGGLVAMGTAMAADAVGDGAAAEPIRITADRLVSDSNKRTAEFSGKVKAVQGQTIITADRLKLTYKDGQRDNTETESIDTIEAQGQVHITFDNRVAVSEKAVYTTVDRKLVLSGPNSKITSGQDVITGSRITFYRDAGRVEIVGDAENQVKATIHSDQSGLN